MLFWILTSVLLTIFYIGIMVSYRREWNALPTETALATDVKTAVTVIIPARNEATRITGILYDLSQINYPEQLLEIIVIDDHSEDNTLAVVQEFADRDKRIHIQQLSALLPDAHQTSAYKKRAIEAAVQLAKGDLIITTDADCRVQKDWIRSIVTQYEQHTCKLIAAPVCFYQDKSSFEKFQTLDFCGMQAITAASLEMEMYNMANGANLAYEKAAFLQVNGYQGIDDKASGDDMLLVYKIAQQFRGGVHFLKHEKAIVYTPPMPTLREFLQQRFRWTSKSGSYQDKRITLILGLVYLFVLSIWLNAFYFLWNVVHSMLFPNPTLIGLINFLPALIIAIVLIIQIIAKTVTDFFFLSSAASFFRRTDLMKTFLLSELWHIWYIPFVGTLGNILPYTWKGRKLR